MNSEHPASTSKLIVDGTKVYSFDSKLAQERSAHDAGLDSDIQGALFDDIRADAGSWMKLLTVRIKMAFGRINISPGASFIVIVIQSFLVSFIGQGLFRS